ncbi:MAG: PmoA family protein [Bacteroidota bacterium]
MKFLFVFLFILLFPVLPLHAGNSISVVIRPVEEAGITPVAISVSGIDFDAGAERLALFSANNPDAEILSQYEPGLDPKMWFMFDNTRGKQEFIIRKVSNKGQTNNIASIETNADSSTLTMQDHPVLSYHHSEVYPPDGVDEKYRRSGFIHPLFSPGGAVLTNIQPPDHYHHYGIWNPWTSTTINEDTEVDFWNLAKGEGRVRFGGYLNKEAGPVYSGIKVRQEHIAYVDGREDQDLLAINELWDVRAWNTDKNVYMVDLTTTLNSPLPGGILLNDYRYGGGIGFRATENWHGENSNLLTSEGKSRDEMDATRARWCRIEGQTDVEAGRSGIVIMSHPKNYSHPEPVRMWKSDESPGKGEIFFMFTPIREKAWKLEPLQSHSLRYRMIVYDGTLSVEEIEKYWNAFARSPDVCIN